MLKNLWNKFIIWLKTKLLPWFKKNWFMFINYIVIILAYNNVYNKEGVGVSEVLLGLWIFASIAYAGFKWFMKKPNLNPQPEPVKPIVKKSVNKK